MVSTAVHEESGIYERERIQQKYYFNAYFMKIYKLQHIHMQYNMDVHAQYSIYMTSCTTCTYGCI